MVNWVTDILTPAIKLIVIGGFILVILFYILLAFYRGWTRRYKFFWKYKIKRHPYPENTIKWVIVCIEAKMNYYDVKKKLLLAMINVKEVNEILWLYEQTFGKLMKGGKNDRKIKGSNSEIKATKLPSI